MAQTATDTSIMTAWQVTCPGPMTTRPLRRTRIAVPRPQPGQVRVRVSVCGVCRTDLHVAEGDLDVHRPAVVPGHEVVGVVDELGPGSTRFDVGDRVGIAWLARTCGQCSPCRRGAENLCHDPMFTGYDVDGGYAEYAIADEAYAYLLPDTFSDDEAAPLLCAGIIGYRALTRSELPTGGRLGIYGFGASAHLAAQLALADGATVHVMTRSEAARDLARRLSVHSVQGATDPPPEPLDSAILFAPAGELVPVALAALDRGGTLAIAGIHVSPIPSLDYATHLFQERNLRSVTANTRADGDAFLRRAADIGIHVETTPYSLDRAHEALADLAEDRVVGAAVLRCQEGP